MVTVTSQMLPLGTKAPPFMLKDSIKNKIVSLETFNGKKGLLVMFICNHCPYVIHIRDSLKSFSDVYLKNNIGIVAINANSTITHPQDGPEEMRKIALEKNWNFPYLFDENQTVAKAFKAACTPDFFLFDNNFLLVYRGQYDDSRPKNNIQITGKDLKNAIDSLLRGEAISLQQKPSMGCNIKWHPGKEPEYFIIPQ
ncbi:MAG: thioredoxin family protein [Candidatus Thorarchaeota archaeon]